MRGNKADDKLGEMVIWVQIGEVEDKKLVKPMPDGTQRTCSAVLFSPRRASFLVSMISFLAIDFYCVASRCCLNFLISSAV